MVLSATATWMWKFPELSARPVPVTTAAHALSVYSRIPAAGGAVPLSVGLFAFAGDAGVLDVIAGGSGASVPPADGATAMSATRVAAAT